MVFGELCGLREGGLVEGGKSGRFLLGFSSMFPALMVSGSVFEKVVSSNPVKFQSHFTDWGGGN